MRKLLLPLLAACGLAVSAIAQQSPVTTYQINTTYYVKQVAGFLPTIQSAVTKACATPGATVDIPAGTSPSDTIGAATGGCTTAKIVDERDTSATTYGWNGSQYVAVPSGGALIQVNGTELTDPAHPNFVDSPSVAFSNPSAGQVTATTKGQLAQQVTPPTSGQYVVLYPTAFTPVTGDAGTGSLAPGVASAVIGNGPGGGPLTNNTWGITWSGFALPADIPSGNVTAVYAFMVSSITNNVAVDYGFCGIAGLTPGGDHTTGSNWALQQFTAATGVTGTNIPTITCHAQTERSMGAGGVEQYYVNSVGLIVYYTGTPSTYGSTAAQVAAPLYFNPAISTLGVDTSGLPTGFPIILGSTSIAANSTTTSLSGLTVNGVTLNAAGSSSLFLNQAGAYATPAGASGVTSINGTAGAFTFGSGSSCSGTTCTFSGGGGTIYGPLQIPNPFTAFTTATDVSPFSVQATNVVGQNCNNKFADGTFYCAAGPAYAANGEYIDDFMLFCLSNQTACTSDLLNNTLTKWESKYDAVKGYPIAIAPNLTTTYFCSGADASCAAGNGTTTGDGRIMVPQALYLYCQKQGIGSTACTTAYTAYVAHIKAAWASVPRDGTTHLFTVPTGPGAGAASEYVCSIAFQEQMRLTGAVAGCNVWYAIDMADMAALATAAGDSTNATFFNSELSAVVTGIRANLIDGSTGLLIAATVQNATNDDIPSSALAVACDVQSDVFAPCGILTSGQKTTIENYFDTNFSSLTNSAGFVLQTQKAGGWTTIGCIPASGGPPYTTSGPGCSATATQYQGGLWTFHAGWYDSALAQVDVAKMLTHMTSFLNGVDPGCEYFNQSSSTCNGTTPNLESPQWAVYINRHYPVGPSYTAGVGCTNKYGALVTTTCGSGLSNPLALGATEQVVTATTNTIWNNTSSSTSNSAVFLSNTSTGGHSWADVVQGSSIGSAVGDRSWQDATNSFIPFNIHASSSSAGLQTLSSGLILGWANGANPVSAAADVAFSRVSSGLLALGTGAAGNSGGALRTGGMQLTNGATPWASAAFGGALDLNNGSADGNPFRGYYAANHNMAMNVSNLGVPTDCTSTEIIRFVNDDGETGGAVNGGIDRNSVLCGWKAISIKHLIQPATNSYAGTCSMSSATTCTFTLTAAYTSTPICIATEQATTADAFAACSVSSTTVTITASASNSKTWGAMLIGNPN